ncbi:MAG TPA: hypothetical protein VF657_16175 [Actinoplanes sp.]|jgi:hypothetical protein
MSVTLVTTQARLETTCPPWCGANHTAPFAAREEQLYGERVHWRRIDEIRDADGLILAEVSVVRRDGLADGTTGRVLVGANADELLDGDQVAQFCAMARRAAAFAEEANRAI